jgi:hypothetical protein
MEPLDDAVDHVRGEPAGRLIIEYGDYECPYSRRAFRQIERVEPLFIDGVVYRGDYDTASLLAALAR